MSLYPVPPGGPRYLVLGEGQLGQAFKELLGERVVTVSHGMPPAFHNGNQYTMRLEVWSEVEAVLAKAAPFITTVVNAAAMTSRIACMEYPDMAYRVNGTAPGLLARWCRANDKKFVQISDAEVFSGSQPTIWMPYDERDDTGEAATLYGDTKRLGERLVQRYHPEALIVRASRLFSTVGTHGYRRESPNGRVPWNTLLHILYHGEQGNEIALPMCNYAVPTDARAVAWGVDRLCQKGRSGVRHVVSEGLPISACQFARVVQNEVAERFGRIYRSPVPYPETENVLPYNIALGTRYSRDLRGMPSWPQALAETLDRFFADTNEE